MIKETAYDRGYKKARSGENLSLIQECLVSAHVQGGANEFGAGYQKGVRDNLRKDLDEFDFSR